MIGTDIITAKKLLESGEVVAIPTETVYGLAGNAINPAAVQKIFEVKQRPTFNPLIIHVPDHEAILKYTTSIPEKLLILSKEFMPGPLTLLLEKKEIIPDLVTAGSSRVAVRIPNHHLSLELLRSIDFPLAAPSANPFGYISPTTARHVEQQLGDKVPYILDGGECQVGIESTIIGMEEDKVMVYRKGGIALEDLVALVGEVYLKEGKNAIPITPGMLPSHYAPKTKLVLGNIDDLISENQGKSYAILTFGTHSFKKPLRIFNLSKDGKTAEAARNLYRILREIDELDFDIILAELLPEQGLGAAINDRLRRAAAV